MALRYSDIPKMTANAHYRIAVSWDGLTETLDRYKKVYNLETEPDFQRQHVWTMSQRVAYVKNLLKGFPFARDLFFNCPEWMGNKPGQMVLVDGLQRLTSVLMFINDELPVFGQLCSEFPDAEVMLRSQDMMININKLPSRKEVLQWYIDLNSGGTVHTLEEIERVHALLLQET